jgi:drug/metabolite transporter (DMT)-like permease
MQQHEMHAQPLKGISLAISAMLLFSISYALFKACNPYLTNTLIIFFQSLFSLLIIAPFALKNGTKSLATDHFWLILLRTILGVVSLYCISRALITVNLAEVILLNNTAPLFVPIIAFFWLRTKMSVKLWVGLLIGFIGIYIILRPGVKDLEPGQLLGLLAGISGGFLLVVMRKIAHEPLLRIMFYYFLLFCVILSPFLFTEWHWPPLHIWAYLLVSGITMISAQMLLTSSLRYATSHEVAPFIYTSVIFAGVIDWIIWGDRPDLMALIGMAVVCIGGVISILITTKKPQVS